MRARTNENNISNKRLLDTREACSYIGMGRINTRRFMDEIGATRRFGKRVLFDRTVIDEALNRLEA